MKKTVRCVGAYTSGTDGPMPIHISLRVRTRSVVPQKIREIRSIGPRDPLEGDQFREGRRALRSLGVGSGYLGGKDSESRTSTPRPHSSFKCRMNDICATSFLASLSGPMRAQPQDLGPRPRLKCRGAGRHLRIKIVRIGEVPMG